MLLWEQRCLSRQALDNSSLNSKIRNCLPLVFFSSIIIIQKGVFKIMSNHIGQLLNKAYNKVKTGFKYNTLNFVFIFIFINLFLRAFGAENTIVAVVFIIVMQSSMLLDFTVKPIKNFFIQLLIMETMVVSAFLINTLNPFVTIPINFIVLFTLLFVFTFEYTTDLYMPYILSYLFLTFISPVSAQMLPKRMLAVLVGMICVMLYHFFMGRNRTRDTVCSALTGMIDECRQSVDCLISGTGMPDSIETVRSNLYKLSHLVYERRKRFLYISDASLAMLDCGLKLENFINMLYNFEGGISPDDTVMLKCTKKWLDSFRTVIQDGGALEPPDRGNFSLEKHGLGEDVYNLLVLMQNRLTDMTNTSRRSSFHPTYLSWIVKVKSGFHASPVRLIYSVRVAILLSVLTALVLFFQLPHGKWLLFTVASVSLPYADDVGAKGKKRFLATVVGGCIAVLTFVFIPSAMGRTAVMLFFGYLTAYFTDYRFSFACSTVGALGGAMLMDSFGWNNIAGMFLIRLSYICIGIAIAYVANRLIYPFKRNTAIEFLCKRYSTTKQLISYTAKDKASDPQLYYNLMVHTLLQEEKLNESVGSNVKYVAK